MRIISILLLLLLLQLSISININDIDSMLDDDEEEEEIQFDFDYFMDNYGNQYGYNNSIYAIRSNETKRFNEAVYLDYTGSGVYAESQIRKCADLLTSNLYGNAHSVNPSSKRTELIV